MLHVKLFETAAQTFDPSFLPRNSGLGPMMITPGPAIADEIRSQLIKLYAPWELNIQTMSEFLRGHLRKINAPSVPAEAKDLKRKGELYLNYATIWKNSFPGEGHEKFLRIFEIFTELRGFTLDEKMMEDLLTDFEPIIKDAISLFARLANTMNWTDEHKACQLIAENLKAEAEGQKNRGECLVFWGFHFLSGSQIDLLNALALAHEVYVLFPRWAYERSQPTDWIRWSFWVPDEDKLKGEQIGDVPSTLHLFPKHHLGEHLKTFVQARGPTVTERAVTFYSLAETSQMESCLEIPFQDVWFKCEDDLFTESGRSLFGEFCRWLYGPPCKEAKKSMEDVYGLVEEKVRGHLGVKGLQGGDLRELKVLLVWRDALKKYRDISEANATVTLFDLRVIHYVVGLNLPRISAIPLPDGEGEGRGTPFRARLRAISQFMGDLSSEGGISILCASSENGQFPTKNYSPLEKIYSKLASIGPLRRAEGEFAFKQQKILEIMRGGEGHIFLERELLQESLEWREILTELGIAFPAPAEEKTKDPVPSTSSHPGTELLGKRESAGAVSPSRLQLYVDCPRKYFLKTERHLLPELKLRRKLGPKDLGQIEHLIIGSYLQDQKTWDGELFRVQAEELFKGYLLEESIVLDRFEYLCGLAEVLSYSKNGILLLLKFLEDDPLTVLEFERPFSHSPPQGPSRKGRLDCVIMGKHGFGIIDFKRSAASVPSVADFMEFKKIQLWFYLHHHHRSSSLPHAGDEGPFFFGHINLKDPGSSLLYVRGQEAKLLLAEVILKGEKLRLHVIRENWEEKMEAYARFEEETIQRLAGDREFKVAPSSPQVCDYCEVKKVCTRG